MSVTLCKYAKVPMVSCWNHLKRNIKTHLHFLPFPPTDVTQAMKSFLVEPKTCLSFINIYSTDLILPEYSGSNTWWRNQMETFPRYWPFVRGTQNSPHKGQWREALMFSSICAWINGWVNNREASDLRRHRDRYDVIVMINFDVCWNLHHMFRCMIKLT